MNLQSNDFELFGVPMQFAQDRAAIDARWRELQRHAHPDKFVAQGALAQRLALQWSVRINEAYQRLKDPLRRASYLCELHQISVQAENNTAMPAAFLSQQLAWREALEDARGVADLQAVAAQVQVAQADAWAACAKCLDVQHDYAQAAEQVKSLMFMARLLEDVQARLALLDK